jgi:glycosyltransferase involved in cell wall biosynthesis
MISNITVLAFAYNEERRIAYFLDALQGLGPVVVVDNFSTDRTVSLAEKHGATVWQYTNSGYAEHSGVASFVLSRVQTEWVYWGRVDEIPPAPLRAQLAAVAQANEYDAVLIPRINMLFGRPVLSWGDDRQLILFRRSAIDPAQAALFEHGPLSSDARVLKLPRTPELALWHFSSYDVAAYTNTNNRYSTIAAREILARRTRTVPYSSSPEGLKRLAKRLIGSLQARRELAPVRVLVNPPLRFIWHYLVHGGIRSGWAGFVTSYLMMMEQMLTELKVWEADRGISLPMIDQRYDEMKKTLIAGQTPAL